MKNSRNQLLVGEPMLVAFRTVGMPLWVTPQEAHDSLRYEGWSQQICCELAEWFARVWSMAFASGYRDIRPVNLNREHVLRMLVRMNYAPHRAHELASVLLGNIVGLHRKGCERRNLKS
jgi:hypothetical protein